MTRLARDPNARLEVEVVRMSPVSQVRHWPRVQLSEVEEAFMRVVIDLKEILVLDGIDPEVSPAAFRIHCHDLYGALPDAVVVDTGDRYQVLDNVIRETGKRVTMARIRQELMGALRGGEFLPPTSTGSGVLVGIRSRGRTFLSEGPSFQEAYDELWRKAVGNVT